MLVGVYFAALVLVAILIALTPVLLIGAVIASRRSMHRHRVLPIGPHAYVYPPRGVAPPRQPAPPRLHWPTDRVRFARLQEEYGRFECDALAVLRTPALADVTVPSTARFVDAFAEAQALLTDAEPPPEHRARFAGAVERAWAAWRAAREAADRIRLAGVPVEEHAGVERAIKLLVMARDSDNEAERAAAYARARTELAKLERSGSIRLPTPAVVALETAARGTLPPGKAS